MDDVKISKKYLLPKEMKAWVLKSPNELELKTKAIPHTWLLRSFGKNRCCCYMCHRFGCYKLWSPSID